ncbi:MAG: hypothetical protein F4146_02225 [Rhodothermaceae bacterium]|nr:hypothetical protein [Rhodothermaceae bacterium]
MSSTKPHNPVVRLASDVLEAMGYIVIKEDEPPDTFYHTHSNGSWIDLHDHPKATLADILKQLRKRNVNLNEFEAVLERSLTANRRSD